MRPINILQAYGMGNMNAHVTNYSKLNKNMITTNSIVIDIDIETNILAVVLFHDGIMRAIFTYHSVTLSGCLYPTT